MNSMYLKILKEHQDFYLKEINSVLDFWAKYGYDEVNGGFLTSLDQLGNPFSNYKPVWAQSRGMYIFATAYKKIEPKIEWLNIAKHTFEFIKNNCFDDNQKMYFLVNKKVLPLQMRRYWFSEVFATIGSILLFDITKEDKYRDLARLTYQTISDYFYGNKKLSSKYNENQMKLSILSEPMMFLNVAQHMREYDLERTSLYENDIFRTMKIILTKHYHEDKQALLENVLINGEFFDEAIGRIINPGHSIECAWFLLDEYNQSNQENSDLLKKIENITKWSFDKGWDQINNGLLYFVDVDNQPVDKLEWDMKLWWPHTEALILYLKLFQTTRNEDYFRQYLKFFKYTINNFKKDDLEWIGYLRRDNTPSQYLKGNVFKGPFHIPRMLIFNYLMIDDILKGEAK